MGGWVGGRTYSVEELTGRNHPKQEAGAGGCEVVSDCLGSTNSGRDRGGIAEEIILVGG